MRELELLMSLFLTSDLTHLLVLHHTHMYERLLKSLKRGITKESTNRARCPAVVVQNSEARAWAHQFERVR